MSNEKRDLASSIKIRKIDSTGKRPASAVTRTMKPSFSNYIYPLSRSRQNLQLQKFSSHAMMIKSSAKEKPNQEDISLKLLANNLVNSRKTNPIMPRHQEVSSSLGLQSIPEKKGFVEKKGMISTERDFFSGPIDFKPSRPGTARTFNSETSLFTVEKPHKFLPKKGLECMKEGKEIWLSSSYKRKSIAESDDLTIQPEQLLKFTDFHEFKDFHEFIQHEPALYPTLKLMPHFKPLQKSESFKNFGISISSKPLSSRTSFKSSKNLHKYD